VTRREAGYTRLIVFLALLVSLGFVGGFLSGLLGIGGGVVMIPLLLYAPPLLGFPALDIRKVGAMTMVQVFVASVLGYLAHHGRRATAPAVVLWMGSGMVVGAGAGALLSGAVSVRLLETVFALLALIAAPILFFPPPADELGEGGASDFSRPLALAGSLTIGLLSGLVGVGGAFLVIPFMIYLLGVPTRAALGSSLGVLAVGGLGGVLGKFETGQIPLLWSALLCAGTVPGSWTGASVSRRIPARGLRLSLAILVALTAVRMLVGLMVAERPLPGTTLRPS
jgi:hypothetical protein